MTAIRMVPEEAARIPHREDRKRRRRGHEKQKWGIRVSALIAVLLLILLGMYKLGIIGDRKEVEATGNMIGAGVKQGKMSSYDDSGKDSESGSNGKSDMTVRLNGYPVFADGRSEGSLNIENPAANMLSMNVEITLDDTGEVIYQSGAIPPGHYIDNDKLTKILGRGTHKATAHVTLLDPDDPDAIFNAANFKLVITVEN